MLVLVVDTGGGEQQIVIQGRDWTVLVPETFLGSRECFTTRGVLRTHVHLAADGSQSRRTKSYLLEPIYTRSIDDINVHTSIIVDSYFGRLFVEERTWSFHISFHGLALYITTLPLLLILPWTWNGIPLYLFITGS